MAASRAVRSPAATAVRGRHNSTHVSRFPNSDPFEENRERSVLGAAETEAQSEVRAAGGDVRKMHNVLSAASGASEKSHRETLVTAEHDVAISRCRPAA